MNTTLSKFMSIAVTALVIAGLIFGVMVTTLKTESTDYNLWRLSKLAPALSTITIP